MQVESTPLSNDIRIDALTQSLHWAGTPGTPLQISGSFAGAASAWTGGSGGYGSGDIWGPAGGVRELSLGEKTVFRMALGSWASVANIRLQEVPDGGTGGGTLRVAWTTGPATEQSFAYGPSSGDKGGDIWLNLAAFWDGATPGSYGYTTLLHEIGHALGLKDPAEGSRTLPAGSDGYVATVMGGSAYAGAKGSWVDFEPTTPMPYDILALQFLYGANTATRPGNDSYVYRPEQRVFETIWDGGGNDTIVWTGTSAVTIDLRPGSWSTIGTPLTYWSEDFKAAWTDARTLAIAYGTVIENATGGSGNDRLIGNDADNRLQGGPGSDTIDGGRGVDTAVFAATRASATVARSGTSWTVTSAEGVDQLIGVERLQFGNGALALDVDEGGAAGAGRAGIVAKILGAVFGPPAVANAAYAGIGLWYLDQGFSYEQLMKLAIDVRLPAGYSHGQVVDLLYTNVVGSPPTPTDRALFTGLLDGGVYSVGQLGVLAADQPLNLAHIDLVGLQAHGLPFLPFGG